MRQERTPFQRETQQRALAEFEKDFGFPLQVIGPLFLALILLPQLLVYAGVKLPIPAQLLSLVLGSGLVLILVVKWNSKHVQRTGENLGQMQQNVQYEQLHRIENVDQAYGGGWVRWFFGIFLLGLFVVGVHAILGALRTPAALPFGLFVLLTLFIWYLWLMSFKQKIHAESELGNTSSVEKATIAYESSKRFIVGWLAVAVLVAGLTWVYFPIPWENGTFSGNFPGIDASDSSNETRRMNQFIAQSIQTNQQNEFWYSTLTTAIFPNVSVDLKKLNDYLDPVFQAHGSSIKLCMLTDKISQRADFEIREEKITYRGASNIGLEIQFQCFSKDQWPQSSVQIVAHHDTFDPSSCTPKITACPAGAFCCYIKPIPH